MKKFLIATLLLYPAIKPHAQEIIIGDMNGDGEITISDVTELTNTLLGINEVRKVSSVQKFIKENKLSGTFIIEGKRTTYIEGELDPYNGYDYVDLGLSVKWATSNIGGELETDYGAYMSWAETSTKNNYSWSTYKYSKGTYNTISRYCSDKDYGIVDNKTILVIEDDAAREYMGGYWRTPTDEELQELIDNCSKVWTNNYKGTGVAGCILTSKKEGYTDKYIFLPAAGYKSESKTTETGNSGIYWSSTVSTYYPGRAFGLNVRSDRTLLGSSYRYYGFSVRAVCK